MPRTGQLLIAFLLQNINNIQQYSTIFIYQPREIGTRHLVTETNCLLYAMTITTKATIASFGGKLLKLTHNATSTKCEMAFNLYLPPQAVTDSNYKAPVLFFLSGLTCTPDNCSEKGFLQSAASKKGISIVYPDTSPRTSPYKRQLNPYIFLTVIIIGGLGISGEDDAYDFGTGAGFYIDATKSPYDNGYNMYTYVTEELPKAVFGEFPQLDSGRVSITGHSMGGHGALTLVCIVSMNLFSFA